jgi:hypothetical protein
MMFDYLKLNSLEFLYIKRVVVVAVIVVIFFGLFFGSGHHDSGCPLAPNSTMMCFMDMLDHAVSWQYMFLTCSVGLVVAIVAIFSLAIGGTLHRSDLSIELRILEYSRLIDKSLFNPFVALFSNGVLNTKVY